MTSQRLGLLALLVAGLAAAGCGGNDEDAAAPAATQETSATGGSAGTTLNGRVGPGFEISLDGTDGLTAGDYTLVVDDKATSHNFHLTGPGVDVATDVAGESQETFQITLEPGEYRFVCDPHASSMNGSFTVG